MTVGALGVAGCVGPTPYVQADAPGEPGYRTTRVTDDIYRISFRGNSVTDRETVETNLLFHAAQLARETGHDWIEIRTGEVETDMDLDVFNHMTSARGFYGYPLGYNFVGYPYYASYPPGVYGTRSMISADKSYTAMAYVEMHEVKPSDDHFNVFKAASVIENLGPRIRRPS